MPILFSFLVFLASTFSAFNSKTESMELQKLDLISFSFKDGSSRELARFFENGIEMNINGNQGVYSKNQAELVIRNFFIKYPPEDFTVIHQSGHENQIIYHIGKYTTGNLLFRVLLKSKSVEEALKIYSIDIIRE